MNLRSKLAVVTVAPLAVLAASASQAALDVGIGTAVATTSADISEAGVLIIGLAVVAMGVRWVKATFF